MGSALKITGPVSGNDRVSYNTVTHKVASRTTHGFMVRISIPSFISNEIQTLLELNQALQDEPKTFPVTFKYTPKKPLPPERQLPESSEELQEPKGPILGNFDVLPDTKILTADSPQQELLPVKKEQDSKETSQTSTQPSTIDDSGYRTIPPNLIMMLKRELGLLNATVEEMGMIEKMIFTLRDPLTATKVRLPIKSVLCTHFECFDLENFCVFNKLTSGVSKALRSDLIRKSNDLKRKDKILSQNKAITQAEMANLLGTFKYQAPFNGNATFNGATFPTYGWPTDSFPTYKCPICNRKFQLNQLFISDIFNFFVKTTPGEIDRIELKDMIKYKIIDNETRKAESKKKKEPPQEVIVLSDDSDTESESPPKPKKPVLDPIPQHHENFDEFDEGEMIYREMLASLHRSGRNALHFSSDTDFDEEDHSETDDEDLEGPSATNTDPYAGSGSWYDPVTLD